MGWHKSFQLYCQINELDPRQPMTRLMFERDEVIETPYLKIDGRRALTWDEIELLTLGQIGVCNIACPYCSPGKHYSRRLQIKRLTLNSARWRCFYCGIEGKARGPGLSDPVAEAEAYAKARRLEEISKELRTQRALRIWGEAISVSGSLAEQYLRARGIKDLPPNVDQVLRYHPRVYFNRELRDVPSLLGLMRDVITNEPRAVAFTVFDTRGKSYHHITFGPRKGAAIKLWPLEGDRLVIGEGLETTLSAAFYILPDSGEPLRPAWALTVADNMRWFPLIAGVKRLVILVDNDSKKQGQEAADECAYYWRREGRRVLKLIPDEADTDFNDIIKGRKS